jgi:hypothetical protein
MLHKRHRRYPMDDHSPVLSTPIGQTSGKSVVLLLSELVEWWWVFPLITMSEEYRSVISEEYRIEMSGEHRSEMSGEYQQRFPDDI